MDVKNRSRDVNIRKPFGLRSNYVQITFNYVQFAQKLRKNYVIFQLFFSTFLVNSGNVVFCGKLIENNQHSLDPRVL